jgi:hypothetical protein
MRVIGTAGLSLVVAFAVTASPLQGQERSREGFWGSVGGGIGFNLTENSEGERLTGFSAFARAGLAITPRWLIAGDVIGWFHSEDEVDLREGFVGGSVLFYPSASSGFYFKGGVGGAFVDVSAGAASDGTTWGFGSALGLGYDIRLGETLNLTIGADWVFQDVSVYTQSNNQLAMLTVGLTFF